MPVAPQSAPVTSARSSVRVVKQRVVGAQAMPPELDFLAIEDPLEITLLLHQSMKTIERRWMVTMRTPGQDIELIHGLLYSEGLIHKASDVTAIAFNDNDCRAPTKVKVSLRPGLDASLASTERHFAALSSCGVCGTSSIADLSLPHSLRIEDDIRVPVEWIHDLPAQMHDRQVTFRQTGGLHAAAIFASDGRLLVSREDIGRHNALDKAIGCNLLADQVPGRGQTLCVSGRMSYEIIQKALVARIPIIVGVGAPSSLAVTLANDFNITLIGFVREGAYNMYSCPERIHSDASF